MLRRFWQDASGASAAEYALIVAVVGPGIGAAALILGANVKASGTSLENDLDATNAVATGASQPAASSNSGTGPNDSPPDNGSTNPATNPGGQACNPHAKNCN